MNRKRFSLVKPTLQTPFHIDFDWWKGNDRNWRVYLYSYLDSADQERITEVEQDLQIDLVDPRTAEVHRVDGLQHLIISRYARREGFIRETTSTAESIFRLLLANGNIALTPVEIGERLGREPKTVLNLLAGERTYKGIRPFLD